MKERVNLPPSFRGTKARIVIDFDIDTKFIALIPAFNINLHSRTFEVEWLVFALYFTLYKWSFKLRLPWKRKTKKKV